MWYGAGQDAGFDDFEEDEALEVEAVVGDGDGVDLEGG